MRPKVVQSLKMIRVANAPQNDQAEVPRVNTKTWIPARLTDLTKASGMRYPGMSLNIYVWVLKFCKDRNRSRVKQTFPESLEQTETLSSKQHEGVIMSSEDPCDTS